MLTAADTTIKATFEAVLTDPNAATAAVSLLDRLEEEVARLAGLNTAAYALERKVAAETFEIPLKMLDDMVKKQRQQDDNSGAQGTAITFDDPQPWHEVVDGGTLLTDIAHFIKRYCVLNPGGYTAAALWLLHTYSLDAFTHSPFLTAQSPEKGCGKSTLLAVLSALAYRALPASNISPAAVFRVIEAHQPTLIIDELDTIFSKEGNGEELRGLLNAGHARALAYVIRVVGDTFEPRKFSVWGAKALAGIGTLPDTLQSRSIVLRLEKKLPEQKIQRLHLDRVQDEINTLKARALRFVTDNAEAIAAYEDVLADLDNRDADNWRPFLALASVAGGGWVDQCRSAALMLTGTARTYAALTLPQQLLVDIKGLFDTWRWERVQTADLLRKLSDLEERPWGTYRGKGLTADSLAFLLKQYGIKSSQFRFGETINRGFSRSDFEAAFTRYIGGVTPPKEESVGKSDFQPATLLQTNESAPSRGFQAATFNNNVAGQNPLNTLENKECSNVAGQNSKIASLSPLFPLADDAAGEGYQPKVIYEDTVE
jgi:putative DNA primase/helicase